MKSIKYFAVAAALTVASFSALSADEINSAQAADQQAIGVVSVSGATNLSSLEASLADKAEQAGAKSYRIVSTTGNNNLHGTAALYN
jgi:multiple stress resistance protein BhsA